MQSHGVGARQTDLASVKQMWLLEIETVQGLGHLRGWLEALVVEL